MARPKGRTRGNGQGTISYDKSRGTWLAKLQVGYNEDGSPKHVKRRAATKTEAEEKLRQLHHEKRTGRLAPSNRLNLGDYLDSWLAQLPADLSPNTRRSYAGIVANHIKPRLGKKVLSSLTHGDIEAMYRQIEASGLKRTPAYVHRVFSVALKEAFRLGHVAVNPMDRVRSPKPGPEKDELYHTKEETKKLLAFLQSWDDTSAKALLLVGITTGARLAEIAGLAWEDVDLKGESVTVRKQLSKVAGQGWSRGPLKTAKGQRVKYLPQLTLDALRMEHSRQMVTGFSNPLGLALLNSEGRPWEHSHANKKIREACEGAGVRVFTSHVVFRHTYATQMLKQGVPLHDVSREMGHSTPNLTGSLYGHHASEAAKRAAKERMAYLED